MTGNVLADAAHIDPPWVTSLLRAAGELEHGRVVRVATVSSASTNARCSRLLLRYSADATGLRPPSLFLKICNEDSAEFGMTEIEWYAKIAAPIPQTPIPKCYHYAYAGDTGRYHLLLEDLSATHHTTWGTEPTLELACKTAVALARIHAYWWDHAHLRDDERYPSAADAHAGIAHAVLICSSLRRSRHHVTQTGRAGARLES
jgi:hypothetical protein